MDPTFPAPSPDDIVSYGMESYRVVALHDRARDAAARAVVGAEEMEEVVEAGISFV
jgi:hypothetical protein